VTDGRRAVAAGQHELLERRERGVQSVELELEPAHMLGVDLAIAGQGQLRAHFEQLVLDPAQRRRDSVDESGLGEQQTDDNS
jgi:hypothetical protein